MSEPAKTPEPEVTEAGGLELPNFPALGEWMDKLRKWCLDALGTIRGLEGDIEELQRELGEGQGWEATYEELAELVRDAERGCREWREVTAYVNGDWVVWEVPDDGRPPPSNVRKLRPGSPPEGPTKGAVGTPVEREKEEIPF